MTDDRLAFLAAILASPDDDLPRLVYADWLDEQGSEHDAVRAEFIRVSCRGTGKNYRGTRKWLSESGRVNRLIEPALNGVSTTHRTSHPILFWEGASVKLRLIIRQQTVANRQIDAALTYRRGFLHEVHWYTVHSFEEFARHLAAVEPIATHTLSVGSRMIRTWATVNVPETIIGADGNLHAVSRDEFSNPCHVAQIHDGHYIPFFHRIRGYDRTERSGDSLLFYARKGEAEGDLINRVKGRIGEAMWGLAHDRAFHAHGSSTKACVLCREESVGIIG